MKYGKQNCIEFYSCYLQQCLLIDLIFSWTPGPGQKGPMNKSIRPSIRKCSEICSLDSSGTQHGVRGPCGDAHVTARCFENNSFISKMGKESQT